MKKLIKRLIDKAGYEIRKKSNGFSLNNNLTWLEKYQIKTVLDIGANEGQFVLFITKLLGDVKIYSFEPIKECYKELINLIPKVNQLFPQNYALGDKNGTISFNKNEFAPSSSMLHMLDEHVKSFPFASKQTPINVNVKRLDDIIDEFDIEENVLVKIDVQGYEDKVVAGGYEFFMKIPKIVFVETSMIRLYENEPLFDDVYNVFCSLGYKFRGILNQLYRPLDGEILQADAVFIKE